MPRNSDNRNNAPPSSGSRPGAAIPAHAHLLDAYDHVVGGAGRRDQDWLMILGGRVVAETDSAAMMLAMLRHTATVSSRAGRPLRVDSSTLLREAATREAEAEGLDLEQYLTQLEAERAERAQERAAGRGDGEIH